ncbi:hypothetical protein C2I27_22820 [Priestia megaterium]|uniref:hypothetical protein n=1 Tax=Priestia megaterium TaxID=1404 RepID=UPI000D50F8D9|nr:hypothetical protein [Priestia megaterium]PVC63347.1 hypothetical protein C2I27_22820 [Priestia megaterium]
MEMCLQYLMIQASKRNHERVKQEVKQKRQTDQGEKHCTSGYKNNCSLERRCEDEMEITVGDLYDFKSCPLRWKYTHLDKVVKKITTNDGIRESIQSVLNFYYFHLQQGEQLTLTDLKKSSVAFGMAILISMIFI